MSTKSTPGPWTVNIAGHYAQSHEVVGDNNTQLVALIYAGTKEARTANAKLIAAAPELLEALQNLNILFKGNEHWPEVIQALNAIKKAAE